MILALKTIRWVRGQSLEFGWPAGSVDEAGVNLCLDSAFAVVAAETGDQRLLFSFDTGAVSTDLYGRFARDFPDRTRAGTPRAADRVGAGGRVREQVLALPEFEIRLGRLPVTLRSANLYTNEDSLWYGNLGMDLLSQARVVAIDFGAMRLSLLN